MNAKFKSGFTFPWPWCLWVCCLWLFAASSKRFAVVAVKKFFFHWIIETALKSWNRRKICVLNFQMDLVLNRNNLKGSIHNLPSQKMMQSCIMILSHRLSTQPLPTFLENFWILSPWYARLHCICSIDYTTQFYGWTSKLGNFGRPVLDDVKHWVTDFLFRPKSKNIRTIKFPFCAISWIWTCKRRRMAFKILIFVLCLSAPLVNSGTLHHFNATIFSVIFWTF